MKFALFFLAEYINMFTVSMLATTLFLGGWNVPLLETFSGGHVPVRAGERDRVLRKSSSSCFFTSGCAERCRAFVSIS